MCCDFIPPVRYDPEKHPEMVMVDVLGDATRLPFKGSQDS